MKYRSVLLLALILIASAAARSQSVSGGFDGPAVSRGTAAKGTVVIALPEGLHINSNKPNSEYAIPTEVRIGGVGVKPGSVDYPEGANRKFQFAESELNVYEGEVKFPFVVTVPRNFRGKTLTVKALVRYQACTEEVCYPPKNEELVITAAVR